MTKSRDEDDDLMAAVDRPVAAPKRRRSKAEIAVRAIRACRNDEVGDLAALLVQDARGLALDLRVALDRTLRHSPT